jgi:hypothetical protein
MPATRALLLVTLLGTSAAQAAVAPEVVAPVTLVGSVGTAAPAGLAVTVRYEMPRR